MKLAVSTQGPEPGSPVDTHFGRARFFRVLDTETGQQTVLDNADGAGVVQGAGPRAVQRLCRLGVQAVLTGHVGPKARTALEAATIEAYAVEGGTAEEAVRVFMAGQLRAIVPAAGGGQLGHGPRISVRQCLHPLETRAGQSREPAGSGSA
ncbi:MAG TPA: NifB/NifX family molybdenum-iron cluster-binding protein [Verrucomicrobiota bacterium]|nr:NifB/NifX family molybdenum-iron cluster-binding protein [Verrucomicrobiota bacterium]HNU52056.1 NifB/NifX family molybdenum-iron cluster-binding protein [Verrucomicrobiota bacterium]